MRTPNLDALAAGGVRYTQFYDTARGCPSRASLLTGLHPHQADVGHMMGDDGIASAKSRLKMPFLPKKSSMLAALLSFSLDPLHGRQMLCQLSFSVVLFVRHGIAPWHSLPKTRLLYWSLSAYTRNLTAHAWRRQPSDSSYPKYG